ncbi:hypothetical protein ACXX9E_29605 [Pseudomonas sp. GNP014]
MTRRTALAAPAGAALYLPRLIQIVAAARRAIIGKLPASTNDDEIRRNTCATRPYPSNSSSAKHGDDERRATTTATTNPVPARHRQHG